MAEPWFKFFPTDWRADPALKMCSLAARGLWIEMLGIMHDAAQYGHLLVANLPPSDADLAMLIGSTPEQISELLGELETRAVFSRTRKGVIYSRKMVRDAKKAETARKNGKKGGNPTLSNKKVNSPSDNPPDKGGDKPQKPEARSQILDGGGSSASATADQTYLERVCAAFGKPLGSVSVRGKTFLPDEAECALVMQWRDDLELTEDQVVAEVDRLTRSKRGGPPKTLAYFTDPLARLAGELKSRTPLTPVEGSAHERPASRDRRSAAADDALRERLEGAARNRSPSKGGIRFG